MYHDKDTVGLRRLYDTVEVHHRGLRALGVNANTYEGIDVPSILTKLPETVRLQITRGKKYEEWKMEKKLNELLCELELREEHCLRNENTERSFNRERDQGRSEGGPSSASALLAKTLIDLCAYCKGEHAHENCEIVKSVEERKDLLRKYVDALFVLVRGIFPVLVRLKICVIIVRKLVITSSFVIGITTRTRHHVKAVAPTMVIVMSRKTSIKPAMPVPPFM